MRCHVKQREHWMGSIVLACVGVLGAGCGSPPSVVPLLEATRDAVRAEARHLDTDAERERHWLDQTRQSLQSAYQRDLEGTAEREDLRVEWVMDATLAYVTACEELTRHELELQQQRDVRRDNLLAAAEAAQRAVEILNQRDALIPGDIGGRAWKLLAADDNIGQTP